MWNQQNHLVLVIKCAEQHDLDHIAQSQFSWRLVNDHTTCEHMIYTQIVTVYLIMDI